MNRDDCVRDYPGLAISMIAVKGRRMCDWERHQLVYKFNEQYILELAFVDDLAEMRQLLGLETSSVPL